ncbi:MAG: hypothetical protein H6861_09290 [Rhodospirillales bacterium]|nr:hypothetical protein [Rhodospirillales bacterium]
MPLFVSRQNFKFALLLSVITFAPEQAQAGKFIYAPYVSEGEVEVESRTEYLIDDNNNVDGSWKESIGIGYGLTNYMAVESYVEFEDEPGEDIEATNLEFEARFQFSERGQYFVDSGLLLEYKHNLSGNADKLEAKGLLAREIGKTQHLVNLVVEKEVGKDASDREELGFLWSGRYMYSKTFDPGIEYYADFGDTTDEYEDQKHRIGPVAYGSLGDIGYDFGVLLGISKATPDATLKLNLEYEF